MAGIVDPRRATTEIQSSIIDIIQSREYKWRNHYVSATD